MKVIDGNIASPLGFSADGLRRSGLRPSEPGETTPDKWPGRSSRTSSGGWVGESWASPYDSAEDAASIRWGHQPDVFPAGLATNPVAT